MWTRLLPLSLLLLSISCARGSFGKTGTFIGEPRPTGCDFAIFTTKPNALFEEIGVIQFGGVLPGTIEATRKKASNWVCANGGNGLLLWESNVGGQFLKATVIHIKN